MLSLSNLWPSNTSIYLKGIYAKTTKNNVTLFYFRMLTSPFGPESKGFQIASSPGIFSWNYMCHLLFKDQHFITFSAFDIPEM